MSYSILILGGLHMGEQLYKYHTVDGVVFETTSLSELGEEMAKLAYTYASNSIMPVQNLRVTNTYTCTDNLHS